MKRTDFFRVVAALLTCAGGSLNGFSAETPALIDLSGVYAENGMTLSATVGMPATHVSLGGLIDLEIDSNNHKKLLELAGHFRVTQQDDLLLAFRSMAQPGRGNYVGTWTKADGLKVDARSATLPRKTKYRPWTGTLHFTLDEERRLVVTAEFVFTEKGLIGSRVVRREKAVYAFPRIEVAGFK